MLLTERQTSGRASDDLSQDESDARIDFEPLLSTYTDRHATKLFLEKGVIRFENTNIVVHTRGASEGEGEDAHMGPLSISFTRNGRHCCEVDGQRFAINEGSYLIQNLGQIVSPTTEVDPDVELFYVGFWPGFAEDVFRSLVTPPDVLLDNPKPGRFQSFEFFNRVYPRDEIVSPVLDKLRLGISAGCLTRGWLEEWNHTLIERMVQVHRNMRREVDALPGVRAGTRAEYYERLHRARDFMNAHLHRPLDLREIAAAAFLSPHHFLRLFKQVFAETPHQYLTRLRLERAQQLLIRTDLPVTEICLQVGFESLGSFSWLFRKRIGVSPEMYRKENRIPRIIK